MPDPISTRDYLLGAGALSLFSACVNGALRHMSTAPIRVYSTFFLVVICGMLFAYLLHRTAYAILEGPLRPWYARSYAGVLFWSAFIAFNVLWIQLDGEVLVGTRFDAAVSWGSRLFILVGTELCAIPILDWPHGWVRQRLEDAIGPIAGGYRPRPPVSYPFPGPFAESGPDPRSASALGEEDWK